MAAFWTVLPAAVFLAVVRLTSALLAAFCLTISPSAAITAAAYIPPPIHPAVLKNHLRRVLIPAFGYWKIL